MFDELTIKNILSSDKDFAILSAYFSSQERMRFIEVLSEIFRAIPEIPNSSPAFDSWKRKISAEINKRLWETKKDFGDTDITDKFNADLFLNNLAKKEPVDSLNNPSTLFGNSDINPFFSLDQVNPAELLELKNFESLKYRAFGFIESYSKDSAIKFAFKLQAILSQIQPEESQQKLILKILNFWVLKLEVFGFGRLKTPDKIRLIKENAADIFDAGLDLPSQVIDIMNIYQSEKIRDDIASDFKTALNGSQDILGSNPALYKINNFQPTVSNWLKEYYSTTRIGTGDKVDPSAFHVVKFLDSNKNASLLNPSEKQILRMLLEFYNLLLSPGMHLDSLELEGEPSYTNQQNFKLPESLQSNPQSKSTLPKITTAKPAAPPVAPQSPKQAPTVPLARILESKAEGPAVSRPAVAPKVKPVDIQDILNKRKAASGLSMGFQGAEPSIIEAQMDNERKKRERQAGIDRKLEELRRKIK